VTPFSGFFLHAGKWNQRIPNLAMICIVYRVPLSYGRGMIGRSLKAMFFREEHRQVKPRRGLRSAVPEEVPGRHLRKRTAPTLSRTVIDSQGSSPLLASLQFATDIFHHRSIFQVVVPFLLHKIVTCDRLSHKTRLISARASETRELFRVAAQTPTCASSENSSECKSQLPLP